MRLQRVHLQNFRQHVNSTIEFRPGLTGIIGPNGAGKTTILEAIAWAIYGKSAARGTNDTIRFSRAAPKAKVVVDLIFELDTHEYRVTRTLNSAELYVDNAVNPIASGVGAVTSVLQTKLGMTRDEFFNTYFTGQKELQFLAQMGPTERGRFLAQVLGYERLRKAQIIAKDRRKEIAAEAEGLRSGLPDPEVLRSERAAAEERVKVARKQLTDADKQRDKLAKQLGELLPAWNTAQETRTRARELTQALGSARRETENAQRELERAQSELQKIAEAEMLLEEVKPRIADLDRITTECEALEQLARVHERRLSLEERQKELQADLTAIAKRVEQIGRAGELLLQTTQEIDVVRETLAVVEKEVDELRTGWNRDLQDVRTQIRIDLTNEAELQEQIKRLKETGKHGACPVCTRSLDDEFETVLEHLESEFDKLRQNLKWRRHREQQLVDKPALLLAAEQRLLAQREIMEKKTERLARCQQASAELWERTGQRRVKEKHLEDLEKELASLPAGYDRVHHDAMKQRLAEVRTIAQQASLLEHETSRREARAQELAAATARMNTASKNVQDIETALKKLKFDEQKFSELQTKFETARDAADAARISAIEAAQVARSADDALAFATRAQAAYDEKHLRLVQLEDELRHHNEMDTAVTQLRTELNARMRPELSELASAFLTDITDGRYNALEIDENYNVLVLEDGEEKPVISGGEEDVANLVLRIAISQMIAERANQQLSTLFLDEVFGSLDLERRDNVIQLLQKLHDRFEQVVLITHVETVREGLDHVIRLAYDERTGASVIREESVAEELALVSGAELSLSRTAS